MTILISPVILSDRISHYRCCHPLTHLNTITCMHNSEARSRVMHACNSVQMSKRVTTSVMTYSVRKYYRRDQYSHLLKKVNNVLKDNDQREDLVKEDLVSDLINDRMDDHEVKVKVNSGVEDIVGEIRKVDNVVESSVGLDEVSGGMVDHSIHLQQASAKINRRSDKNSYDSNLLLCRDQNLHVVVDGSYILSANIQSTVNKKDYVSETYDVSNHES